MTQVADSEVVESAADAASDGAEPAENPFGDVQTQSGEPAQTEPATEHKPAAPGSIQALRKEIREKFPQLRGQVSLYIKKDEADSVLAGTVTPDDLANLIQKRIGTHQRVAKMKATKAAKAASKGGTTQAATDTAASDGDLASVFAGYAAKRKRSGKPITAAEIATVRSLLDLMGSLV
jgi:chorismate mutase